MDYYTDFLNLEFASSVDGFLEGTGVTLTQVSGTLLVEAVASGQYAYRAIQIVDGVDYQAVFDVQGGDEFDFFIGDKYCRWA